MPNRHGAPQSSATICRRPDRHPYELFLRLEDIKDRTTQSRIPQSNGLVERLHRTLLDGHFRVLGRTKFYESIQEMQTSSTPTWSRTNLRGRIRIAA